MLLIYKEKVGTREMNYVGFPCGFSSTCPADNVRVIVGFRFAYPKQRTNELHGYWSYRMTKCGLLLT
jgi:hypothetical protein